jgi:drug/metabolite transporter (DMT)-like permease
MNQINLGLAMGEWIALGCALSWSISVILFKKSTADVSPLHLNLFKNLIGLSLLIPTALLAHGAISLPAEQGAIWQLAFSGIIGIGIADGLALIALKRIGASRFAVVECIYAPSIVVMSYVFLGETINWMQVMGGLLIVGAVFWINIPEDKSEIVPGVNMRTGTIFGLISIASMAYGVILTKPYLNSMPLLWLIIIRLLAGTLASFLTTLFTDQRFTGWRPLLHKQSLRTVLIAGFFSTYISMMLWVSGFKYASTVVAASLNQTATIWTVLLAAFFLRERLSLRQILGTMIAFAGVIIITSYH